MTTIVTRLYASSETAAEVIAALAEAEADGGGVAVVTAGPDETGVAERIASYGVPAEAAAAYAPHVQSGGALVVARCEFAPIGAALRAMETMDAHVPVDVGLEKESFYKTVQPKHSLFSSVLEGAPLMLTNPREVRRRSVSEVMGMKAISRRDPRERSVMKGSPHVSTKFLPIPLIERRKNTLSVIPGGKQFTRWLLPTVSRSR